MPDKQGHQSKNTGDEMKTFLSFLWEHVRYIAVTIWTLSISATILWSLTQSMPGMVFLAIVDFLIMLIRITRLYEQYNTEGDITLQDVWDEIQLLKERIY